MSAIAEVMDFVTLCHSIPEDPECMIIRDNYISSIEARLKQSNIVLIEGDPGVGKTTLLSQFAKKYCENALSFFRCATSPGIHQVNLARVDICNQISWELKNEELEQVGISTTEFNLLISKLRRGAKRRRKRYYVVLDGLEDLDEQEVEGLKLLIGSLVPDSNLSLVMSSSKSVIPQKWEAAGLIQSVYVSHFTEEETNKYFSDLTDQNEILHELFKVSGGLPAQCATIRRLHKNGKTFEELLQLPDELLALSKYEWNSANLTEQDQSLLATIVYDNRVTTIDSLSNMLEISREETTNMLANIPFIKIDGVTEKIEFVSESIRKLALKRLKRLQRQAVQIIIDDMLATPASRGTLSHLPLQFEQSKMYPELLNFLTPETLIDMLNEWGSLTPLIDNASRGLRSATFLKEFTEQLRFSVMKSNFEHFRCANMIDDQLHALIAIGDIESAIELAEACGLLEDRLHSLAKIARAIHQEGDSTVNIVSQIEDLFPKIDHANLGGKAVDIAIDLVYSCPALATQLMEAATASLEHSHSKELAYLKFGVITQIAGQDMTDVEISSAVAQSVKWNIITWLVFATPQA